MRIEGLAVALPSGRISNDDVVESVSELSKPRFKGELGRTLRMIRIGLGQSGFDIRTALGKDETPVELMVKSMEDAIEMAGGDRKIDCLITAGVYKEYIEPSTSNALAALLDLSDAAAFDLTAACDGFMKAALVAQALIETGVYRRIMVVNGEFVMRPGFGIFPELYKLTNEAQLEWRFPAFTLGEAASTVILGAGGTPWRIINRTSNNLYDRCSILAPWAKAPVSKFVAKDGPGMFTSFGAELKKFGYPMATNMLRDSNFDLKRAKFIYPHTSSRRDWQEGADELGVESQIYHIAHKTGNLVSASVPAAMAMSLNDRERRLTRGDDIIGWIASAGMTASAFEMSF